MFFWFDVSKDDFVEAIDNWANFFDSHNCANNDVKNQAGAGNHAEFREGCKEGIIRSAKRKKLREDIGNCASDAGCDGHLESRNPKSTVEQHTFFVLNN